MRILITGGAGFIASHVVDAYVAKGHKVAVIDNLSTGFRKNVNPKTTFYKADLRNAAAMARIIAKEKPLIVNHHAAIAEVVKSLRDPIPTLNSNVLGTVNLLIPFGNLGKQKGKKFIFSSTGGAIYGEPEKIPADELTPKVPLSPYGLSKLLGEECIDFYARHYGFDYLIFRYPNVFGPRQNPKGEAGVVAIFGGLMKRGVRPTIFGNGTKTRDYMYVEDVARANVIGLTKGKREIVNIGWGKKVSDRQIFDAVAKHVRFRGKPIYKPFRKGEVYQIALSAKKAKRVLGWSPHVHFDEGVRRTMAAL